MLAVLAAIPLSGSAQPQAGIPAIVPPGVQPELVKEDFQFTEGPVGAADGTLCFSDLRASRIYRLDVNGRIEVLHEQTGGANGLAFAPNGDLLAAVGDGKRIARITGGKLTALITEGANHKPLLAPNDLILDAKGGLYFTDPGPRPLVAGRKAYVYYLPAGAKTPLLLNDEITRPNGITLTLDGKTLIVDDTVGDTVYAFDIQRDGRVKNKRAFVRLHDTIPGEESGADGMALDREGRLYVTTASGVQIFGRTGRYLGTIKVPRQAANVAFAGPDKRVLYITAREGLYRITTLTQGPARLGK